MERLARESFVVEFIKEVRLKDPGIGGNKLWQMYRKRFGRAHSVGYNRFYDIIEKYGLKVRSVKRRVKTTDSSHDYPVYPDLTRSLIPDRPCQLVVSDITYIPYWIDPLTGEYQFCSLSGDGLLHQGNRRLQCRPHVGGQVSLARLGDGPQAL